MDTMNALFSKVVAKSLFVLFIVSFSLAMNTLVVLAAPYGDGNYGGGEYGVGEEPTVAPTSTSTNNNSGNSGSSSNSNEPKTCTNEKPNGSPDLFQIDRNGSSAKVFVTAAGNPYNRFFIAYGVGGNTDQYAVAFDYSDATGVMDYTIQDLDPATTYSFKVQAMNGCMPGNWSNTLAVRTKSGSYYKYDATQFAVGAKAMGAKVKNLVTGNKVTTPTPEVKKTETVTPTSAVSKPTTTQPTQAPQPPAKEEGGIINWFKNLFK